MINSIGLNEKYSTTRLLTKEKPEIVNNPEDKFETVLFLPEGENRKGEGGLRTKGYFKKSYEDKSLISIVTVVYNGEKYLEETIQSVINQTYDNVEYIIIDGGSTDGTLDIIKKYEDRVDYWASEKDSGIYDAMNKGISLFSGDYLFFLGADDFIKNTNILYEVNKELNINYNLVYGNIKYTNGTLFKSVLSIKTLFFNTIHHQGAFYKKTLFKNFRYNTSLSILSDYELNLIIYLKKIPTKGLNIIICSVTPDGESQKKENIWKSIQEINSIRKKYLGYKSSFFSIILIIRNLFKIL